MSSNKIEKWCNAHKKVCLWSSSKTTTCIERRKENLEKVKNNRNIPEEQTCNKCNKTLHKSFFDSDNSKYSGLKSKCKSCIKENDYKKYNTWKGYTQKKIVASWKAHNNKEMINILTIEEGLTILEKQNYKCNHCNIELECKLGNQIYKNYNGASLDRIDVSIVGYGNGNSQWLCMSCNNGKNTMPDIEHKNKFYLRDLKIEELKSENEILKSNIIELEKEVLRLRGGM